MTFTDWFRGGDNSRFILAWSANFILSALLFLPFSLNQYTVSA